MINQRGNKKEQSGGTSFPVIAISLTLVIVILISVLLFFFYPQFFESLAFQAARVKNAFSYYILQDKPEFYYL